MSTLALDVSAFGRRGARQPSASEKAPASPPFALHLVASTNWLGGKVGSCEIQVAYPAGDWGSSPLAKAARCFISSIFFFSQHKPHMSDVLQMYVDELH